jgi:hypothetical protein
LAAVKTISAVLSEMLIGEIEVMFTPERSMDAEEWRIRIWWTVVAPTTEMRVLLSEIEVPAHETPFEMIRSPVLMLQTGIDI